MAKIRESQRKAESRKQHISGGNDYGGRRGRDVSPFEQAVIRRIHSKEFRSKGHNLQREFTGFNKEF